MSNMLFLGIDPGITGCLALLAADSRLVDHLSMPYVQSGKSKRVNSAGVAEWLKGHQAKEPMVACLESVGAMPGQGVSSMFNFGHSLGSVEGILASLGIPYTLVTPQTWKRHHRLVVSAGKDAARARAIQLYPYAPLHAKAKGQALADAILIARYGLETR